jgi:hypothetical protein
MEVPQGYKSKDVIDRRGGEQPSVGDKVRDAWIATKRDWSEMRETEKRKRGEQPSMEFKQLGDKKYPTFKKGGVVRKTGLVYAHKGETIIPKKAKMKATRRKGTARKK